MKIKQEAIIADTVSYCVDIQHDGKLFYASTIYWLHSLDSADWVIDSDDCDFDALPLEYQQEIREFANKCWEESDIFIGFKEELKVKKY